MNNQAIESKVGFKLLFDTSQDYTSYKSLQKRIHFSIYHKRTKINNKLFSGYSRRILKKKSEMINY